jgi:putative transferase (TIGR04331 family)
MFLITTADQRFWKKSDKVLFLGEWCKVYSQRHAWSKINYEVLPYHWDDRGKLRNDFLYLDELYERYLLLLVGKLNVLHGVDYSPRYWRILIGPWLIYFIEILYDRYLSISMAVDSGKVTETWICSPSLYSWVPKNYATLQKWSFVDEYNQYLYSYLIRSIGGIPFQVKKETVVPPDESENNQVSLATIPAMGMRKVFEWYGRIIPNSWKEVIFVSSYIGKINQLKLQLLLRQLPYLVMSKVMAKERHVDSEMRQLLRVTEGKSQFEKILGELIPFQICKTYVECYGDINKKSRKVFPKKSKVIYTTNAVYENDPFKLWVASQVEKGSKLVGSQHGGTYGSALWSSQENHENRISDAYFTWGWKAQDSPKQLPLPSGQLFEVVKKIRHDPRGDILLITMSSPRYSYRMYSTPVSSQMLNYIEDQEKFVNALSPEARSFLKIRKIADDYWNESERWNDFDSQLKIQIQGYDKSIFKQLCRTRLSVCTYNATTFLETFAANFPTIIFWNPDFFELRDSAKPFFRELREANILHDNPKSAATKINQIYQNPMIWWNSPDVQKARQKFCRRFAWTNPDWMLDWQKQFKKLMTE